MGEKRSDKSIEGIREGLLSFPPHVDQTHVELIAEEGVRNANMFSDTDTTVYSLYTCSDLADLDRLFQHKITL